MKGLIIIFFGIFTSYGQISVYKATDELTTGVKPTRDNAPLYDIALLNYADLNSIEKFKKAEFGIELDSKIKERIELFLAGDLASSYLLNPFIEDDLNPNTSELAIHATFIHTATQTAKERDFFYYHQYEQVGEDWNGWSDAPNSQNNYCMRVRFAPPLSGEWQSVVTLYLDGKTIQLPVFTFQVKENNHPGYVKIHSNKRNLELGEQIVFPLGHVFPGPYNRAKGGQVPWGEVPNGTHANTSVADWNQYHGDIKSYIEQGGKSFKLTQTAYGNLLEFEEKGNYIKRMHYAWEQDKILDLCEENGVLVNFNLLFQDVIMGYGQNGGGTYGDPWDYGNYGKDGPVPFSADYYPSYCYFVPGTLPSHQFLDSVLMNYHKQRTRYYVARYGYSPQIYTWELMSEPFHMDQFHHGKIKNPITGAEISDEPATSVEHPGHKVAIEAINVYHNVLSDYIKNELKDQDHLITINQAIVDENSAIYPYQSAFNPLIDIVGYNYYSEKPFKLVDKKEDKNGKNNLAIEEDEKSIYNLFYKKFNALQKPIILSESGHASSILNINCYETAGNIIDVMTLGFTGIAGMHPWEGYKYGNYNQFDERLLWTSTIAAEKQMNSDMVFHSLLNSEGDWKQGRQIEKVDKSSVEYPKELEYYISPNNDFATGYVRNRSFNTYTMRKSDNCHDEVSIIPNTKGFYEPLAQFFPFTYDLGSVRTIYNRYLYVTGLDKKSNYEITWYDFITGNQILTSQRVATDGKSRIKLEFPALTLENPQRPIVWFSIKRVDENK